MVLRWIWELRWMGNRERREMTRKGKLRWMWGLRWMWSGEPQKTQNMQMGLRCIRKLRWMWGAPLDVGELSGMGGAG